MIRQGMNRWLLPELFLVIMVVLAYLPALNGPFVFDDKPDIVNNPWIQAGFFDAVGKNPFRLITYLSYYFNNKLTGMSSPGFRSVNILIHIANIFLVGRIFSKIINKSSVGRYMAMLFFGLAPIATSAVCYISARSTLLATMFGLISILIFIEIGRKDKGKFLVIFGTLIYIISLECKEVAACFPLIMFVLYFYRDNHKNKSEMVYMAGACAVTLFVYFLLRINYIVDLGGESTNPYGFAMTQPGVWAMYFRVILLPFGQNLDYDIIAVKSVIDPRFWLPLFGIMFFTLYAMLKNYKRLIILILWFIIALLPESSVIPLNDYAFEHRAYISLISVAMFFGYMIVKLAEKQRLMYCSIIITLLFAICVDRNNAWCSELKLWRGAAIKSPNKVRTRYNLGVIYDKELKQIKRAAKEYIGVLEIEPDKVGALINLGVILLKSGQVEEGGRLLKKAVKIEPGNSEARLDYGIYFLMKGNVSEAIGQLSEAERINPESLAIKEALNRARQQKK